MTFQQVGLRYSYFSWEQAYINHSAMTAAMRSEHQPTGRVSTSVGD
jgi:hypothetical protein